ncbi:MAG: group III truncated hemoglobin [Flavobacteriales bacterium]|nr:group III truncated hemoglobin [Flavobacteriales bacterium]MCB9448630.1 group III truncated hemoglobin [Flavobacteriales bacterium]
MPDIETRKDIEILVDAFYKKVITDERIGDFFTKVVKLDWNLHIPIMYDFWESMLLKHTVYNGNPMIKHIDLNRKKALKPEHFECWFALWEETVNEHFHGEKAGEAISKARQIGGLMMVKIRQAARN